MKQDCECWEICSGGADAAVASGKARCALVAGVLLVLGGTLGFLPLLCCLSSDLLEPGTSADRSIRAGCVSQVSGEEGM